MTFLSRYIAEAESQLYALPRSQRTFPRWQRILRAIIRERRSTMPKKKGGRRY